MADSASELESDTNSMNDGPTARLMTPNHIEYMQRRMESLQQENVVLKTELEKYKQRVKTLEDDNVRLRRASVSIVCFSSIFFSFLLLKICFLFKF